MERELLMAIAEGTMLKKRLAAASAHMPLKEAFVYSSTGCLLLHVSKLGQCCMVGSPFVDTIQLCKT